VQVVVHHLSTPSCCQQRKEPIRKLGPADGSAALPKYRRGDELNRSFPDHSLVIQFSD
jgi:hypothetical protein